MNCICNSAIKNAHKIKVTITVSKIFSLVGQSCYSLFPCNVYELLFQLNKFKSKRDFTHLSQIFWGLLSLLELEEHLWNINWSNAQCSPFLGPGHGRSLIPTAVKSLFSCVMFCLINKSSSKFGFGQLWFHS